MIGVMSDTPRIHLGATLSREQDAHAEGEITELRYQQGQQEQVLQFAEPAFYEVDVNALGHDEMYLQGSFSPTLVMECSRCLRPVEVPLEITLGTLMRYDPAVNEPYLEEADTGEELLVFGKTDLDLSAYLAETTLLAAPLTVLHAPDCKGLCQVCGHDLNEPGCGLDPNATTCDQRRPVPVEEIDDLLGNPEGSAHAKQNPFAALKDLNLPED